MTIVSDAATLVKICLVCGIAIISIMVPFGVGWLIRSKSRRKAEMGRISKLEMQLEEWRTEGYDVSSLEDSFK